MGVTQELEPLVVTGSQAQTVLTGSPFQPKPPPGTGVL